MPGPRPTGSRPTPAHAADRRRSPTHPLACIAVRADLQIGRSACVTFLVHESPSSHRRRRRSARLLPMPCVRPSSRTAFRRTSVKSSRAQTSIARSPKVPVTSSSSRRCTPAASGMPCSMSWPRVHRPHRSSWSRRARFRPTLRPCSPRPAGARGSISDPTTSRASRRRSSANSAGTIDFPRTSLPARTRQGIHRCARRSCAIRCVSWACRRWRPSGGWPAASHTTSTTSCRLLAAFPRCCCGIWARPIRDAGPSRKSVVPEIGRPH